MAISPPGDIVMDVVRAADPTKAAQAREQLTLARSSATSGNSVSFNVGRLAEKKTAPESFVKFEAMVLQSFVQAMLPKDAEQVYGSGIAGDMWKGMMAEHIADAIARGGGIGIAEKVLNGHTVDEEGNKTAVMGIVDSAIGDKDREALRSDALVSKIQTEIMRGLDEPRNAETINKTSRQAT
ncbi:rod-binding protein [Limoniibacter endophyticus]|uniref:Flagellar protein FlgJ N-terminal domain-containing protein n=1 Tax=Limoniibacter endophyticus TaxID=1565040 RepID=A0A8J3DEU5_9HYPH|nr:rod-binding protein [Limoniibacter endophyticus]GHC64434.1 hypothetical protein GCM10010136_06380 [Limoniibacter endophyticus]